MQTWQQFIMPQRHWLMTGRLLGMRAVTTTDQVRNVPVKDLSLQRNQCSFSFPLNSPLKCQIKPPLLNFFFFPHNTCRTAPPPCHTHILTCFFSCWQRKGVGDLQEAFRQLRSGALFWRSNLVYSRSKSGSEATEPDKKFSTGEVIGSEHGCSD